MGAVFFGPFGGVFVKKPVKIGLIVLLAAVLLCVPQFACSPRGAALTFALHREAFTLAARESLAAGSGEGVERPPGVSEINVWGGEPGQERCVEFSMGGAGLGPSTSYWGVTYSQSGPVGFQGVRLDYAQDGDDWVWQEPNGDNRSRVIPLEENWYLYEMRF